MIKDPEIIRKIAYSLSKLYECVYLICIESGHYYVFANEEFKVSAEFPDEGDDFFLDATTNAARFMHPDDVPTIRKIYDKDGFNDRFDEKGMLSVNFRSVIGGETVHMRHIMSLCDDGEHVICCLQNVESEYREKQEQLKILKSAELMARRDDLTGVRNSNAFQEFEEMMNGRIAAGELPDLGIVMCDINDLKIINDTRGHNSGDEAIRATSRLICNTYRHSPVFRIGGDEFVVVLEGEDYERRDSLIETIMEESEANRKAHSWPVIACGMSLRGEGDTKFQDVLERADQRMYVNKKELKSANARESFGNMETIDEPIPDERRRLLEALFGAFVTVAGGGYIYLNDMRYDFSRWAVSLVDDFGLESEYMYHADKIWKDYIHPDDLKIYQDAVDLVLRDSAELVPIVYRARQKDGTYVKLSTRGFVLTDSNGDPEYFGGIIIRH